MRRSFLIAALLAAVGLVPALAGAQLKVGGGGVEVMAPNTAAAVSPPEAQTATVRDNRRAGGQTLRCWKTAGSVREQRVPRRTRAQSPMR